MKTLKIRICTIVFFSAIICLACNDSGAEQYSIEVLNPSALNQSLFADRRSATSVNFVTSSAWTSTITEEAESWILFEPQSGNAGQHSVTIALQTNATGATRTAVFTIQCGNQEREITIRQVATDGNGNMYIDPENRPDIIVLNEENLYQELFADQRFASSVRFDAAREWTSTISEGDEAWVEYSPTQGTTPRIYSISISLTRNDSGSDRTATITISSNDEEVDIIIYQKSVDRFGNPYDPGNAQISFEEYLKMDWSFLDDARAQAIAENRDAISPTPRQRLLFIACTNVTIGTGTHTMDDTQRQFFRDVVTNFVEVVEYWSNGNVIIEADMLFIERLVVVENTSPTFVSQNLIQAELNLHAPIGSYDGVLVTAARTMPNNVHLGVKTAGYENLLGYGWFKLLMPTGNQTPPTTVPYVMPKADEPPFLSTNVAVHEWLHMLEFKERFLDYTFPNVHGYQNMLGYGNYPGDPVWDYAVFYQDIISGNVQYTPPGGTLSRIGMFPLMWRITPRLLNSRAVYIKNEANNMYLTYSGNTTNFSNTPMPWYIRYNRGKYMLLTADNRSLDIANASNTEGNSVGIFGVNGAYPQAQNFVFTQNADGTYKLTTTFIGGVNRVLQRNTGASAATTINTDNGSIDQKWRFIDSDNNLKSM